MGAPACSVMYQLVIYGLSLLHCGRLFCCRRWQGGCRETRACYGWDTPFSLNATRNYENSAIHPRPKQPLGNRLARAYLALVSEKPPLLPVFTGCSAVTTSVEDVGKTSLRLSFRGLGDSALAEPTFSHKWHGASGLELEIDGNWTFVDAIGLGITRSPGLPGSIDVQLPSVGAVTGVRYSWSDNPCCGSNNRTVEPCPPMACPLITQGALPEPVVPFLATVRTTTHAMACVCDPPMVC